MLVKVSLFCSVQVHLFNVVCRYLLVNLPADRVIGAE